MIRKGRDRLVAAVLGWLAFAGGVQAGVAGGIAGQVTEAGSGTPIAGVQIVFYPASGGTAVAVATGADGHFDSGLTLPPDGWYVRTVAPAHLDEVFDGLPCEGNCDPAAGTPVPVSAGNTAVANFSLDPGAAVAGRVTGPGGLPVANAAVQVWRPTGGVGASALTDADGDYQTERSLAAGSYRVTTTTPFALVDELYPDVPCPGGNCALTAGGDVAVTAGGLATGIDFELAAGARLSGRVTRASDAAPVAGSQVFVRYDQMLIVTAPTAPDGEWQSPALPPGDWKLFATRTGPLLGRAWSGASCDVDCGLAASPPVQVSGTTPVTDLDFALEAGAVLSGQVTAAAGGAPVASAFVNVHDVARGITVASGFSLPDGSYATEAFLPGTVKLSASAANFTMSAHGANCEPACAPDSGAPIAASAGVASGYDFALQSGGALRGVVTGPGGPLANVLVHVLRADGQVTSVLQTDALGRYDTGYSLGAASYRVRTFNLAGFVDEAWPDLPCVAASCTPTTGDLVAVTTGQATVADFALVAGGRITGEVRRAADGTPVATPTLHLTNAAGLLYSFPGEADGSYDTRTGLPPGDYHLVASSAVGGLLSEVWQEQPCSPCGPVAGTPIPMAGTAVVTDIDFTLERGATLSGRALDGATGLPVAAANILVFDPQSLDVIAFGVTGADGRYVTHPFVPQDVLVLAQTVGYLNAIPGAAPCDGDCSEEESPLLHAVHGDLPDIDFTLRRGSQVSGRVQTPGGAPVEGVKVSVFSNDYYLETTTDAAGDYAFELLPNGRYLVLAEGTGAYVATAWPGVQCVFDCSIERHAALLLDDDDVRTDIDITLVQGGTIGGRVEGMPGNIAQPGSVSFYERETLQFVSSAPLAGGQYTSAPLPPAEYLVFTVTTGGYIDEMFDDVSCPYTCDDDLGTPVAVAAGVQATVDFELVQGGRIAGRVFNAATNAAFPLRPSVQVRAADYTLIWSGSAQSNGNYTTAAVPPGTYYVRSRNRSGFLDEFFLDEDCFWCVPVGGIDVNGLPVTPTPVSVTLGATVPNVDLGLAPGRRLGGRVAVEPGDLDAELTNVQVFDANGRLIVSVPVLAGGEWLSPGGFAPGTYYLRTLNFGLYADELFGGASCPGTCDVTQGTPVVLTAAADLTDLDFSLARLPRIHADGFE